MVKKVLRLIGVVIYLLCATQVLALELEWRSVAPMPTGRDGLAVTSLNGKIYAIGGRGGLNVVEEFDPTVEPNGTWTRKADMPTGRWGLAAVALNGKIYAIGGDGGLNIVEEFDPTVGPDGTWTTKAPMPTPRYLLGVAALNGKIYAIGGKGGKNVVEEFDPTVGPDGTWTTKAPMPTGRYGLAVTALNGKIYAIGGMEGKGKVVEEYDPTTNTWTRKADMPIRRDRFAAISLNGKIYTIGGGPEVMEATLGAPANTNIVNGSDTGTLNIADTKGDALLIFSGIAGTKIVTCAATITTIMQGYGIGYLASPKDQSVMPTATLYYNYEVSNSSNGTDTITISAEVIDGATWTVFLIDDTNQDGFHQDDENTLLSSQITLKQNESYKFFLKVDVSIAGSATIRVKAESSHQDTWGDPDILFDDTLTFARGYGVVLSSPSDLSGSPSTTIYYTYQLTNTGNATDTITLVATNISGGTWTLTIIRDDNQDGIHQETETTQIGSITLASGQSNYFFLKVDIPAAEIGATSTNKVIAKCSGTDTVAWKDPDTAEDITITTCSAPVPYLVLEKYVSPADAQLPGATLTYTLKYKNIGNAEAINVMIQDVIPAWAIYVENSGTGTVGTGGGDSISAW
jgi:uncharacterized repeat protein (TIGR01451 family)